MSKLLTALCLLLSLIASASVSAAESFGRLFTTPSERSNLDYLRQTTKAPTLDEPSQATLEAPPPVPVIPDSISMQGYVKRSDGQRGTVWVNHQPIREGSSSGDVRVGGLQSNGNQVSITTPANGRVVNLKAGQVYDTDSNSIVESSKLIKKNMNSETLRSGTIGTVSDEDQKHP